MRSAFSGAALAAAVALITITGGSCLAAPQSEASKALTAPSGSGKMARAKQCDEQTTRQNLQGAARQAFYKSCLASAAPVAATGSKDHPAVATPAKAPLEGLTDAPPR